MDNAESLASAMRGVQASTAAAKGGQRAGSVTCPFSRMAAGYMALLGRSRAWAAAASFPGHGGTYLAERESL